jgi:hypothetical protein
VSLDATQMAAAARDLIVRVDPTTAGLWPRAVALLTRQALETALDDLWRIRAPGVEECSARAQLICLPSYLRGNERLAERVAYAWSALTWACHQHPYELPPTSSELLSWLGTVEQLVEHVRSI